MIELTNQKCKPCEGLVAPLTVDAATILLQQLDGWQLQDNQINKCYSFKNYYQTMAFVNAVAWISHREDHHPDMVVGYNRCDITYTTHAIGGLSENDFICAAKVDKLFND
ncbi:4a-hydroxytetrahydrobiopterin dehydratase [Nitrosomonas aestuarii]|uniref:4a-hydroxytetrahydrobiopterin dehydratase n=1 Tax=Nitrosomonas aestuarii TaxID=52441 RepID=UPI000D31FF9D|nr:4a-hydroxytetrahydrobiopterin dehydratase [Nitrosomonas aestuarii]PTN12472.1 pterin-4-alpha-carbinolamine dehydratase [Nitrosomonas aestuarii]